VRGLYQTIEVAPKGEGLVADEFSNVVGVGDDLLDIGCAPQEGAQARPEAPGRDPQL